MELEQVVVATEVKDVLASKSNYMLRLNDRSMLKIKEVKMEYKLSRFNVIKTQFSKKDEMLIFNSLQRSIIKIPIPLYSLLQENDFHNISDSILNILIEAGIIVQSNIDEMRTFMMWYDSQRLSNEILGITFLPTYSCNCKCIYCYEEGTRKPLLEKQAIPEKKLESFYSWIESFILFTRPRTLDFAFHGGEPLLQIDIIEKVAKKINDIADSHSLNKMFSIVTNGTLLNDKTVDLLRRYSFNRALFTIDGLKDVHNLRRPFESGRGTWEITYKNMLCALEKGMEIVLGVNVDKQNYENIPEFLDFIKENGVNKYNNFTILFGITKPGPRQKEFPHFKKYEPNQQEEYEILSNLYELAISKGIKTVNPIGMGLCSMKTKHQFIIDEKGDIYKCVTLVGEKEALIGNIEDPYRIVLNNLSQLMYSHDWMQEKGCKDCKFLPICLGGCAQQALVKNGDINSKDCLKPFLTKYLPEAIKIEYKRRHTFPEELRETAMVTNELLRK